MKAQYRLKKSYQFNYVYKKGQSASDKNLVLLYCPLKNNLKIGFSVSKKYGHAVARNRIRRQLRVCATLLLPRTKRGYTLVWMPRATASHEFSVLLASMEKLLTNVDLLTGDAQ
ncbi:MAG: ribonuclease P protein component [Clostridia bacterium]